MPLLSGITSFLDKYILGYAIGTAAGPALRPYVQDLVNEAWTTNPVMPPFATLLAQAAAKQHVDPTKAAAWSKQQGFDTPQFDAMVQSFHTAPAVPQAYELWRRGAISDTQFTLALKREGLEDIWMGPLAELKRELLSPAELANAVVQNFRSQAAAAADAERQGIDAADFQTMVDVTGMPPGPETLQAWTRRGIIDGAQLDQGIREGHTKNKYVPFYEASLAQVLSATDYAGLFLRGWITRAEMDAGGALTGYSPEQMDALYKDRGRPATTHQVHIGYARGGRLAGVGNNERETFNKAIIESDIRPEWSDILWAQRYTYPSAFVLRGLTQAGDITQAQTEQILLYEGWEPILAAQVAKTWATKGNATGKAETKAELAAEYEGGYLDAASYRTALQALGYSGATLDLEFHLSDARRIARWREKVVDAIGKAYLAHELTDAEATVQLASVGVTAEAATNLLALWKIELGVARRRLTAAQVKRAYKRGIITQDEAMAQLQLLDYSAADAATYLAS